MMILKLSLLNVSCYYLMYVTAFVFHSKNGTVINYRLPDNVIPMHYNIKIIPYIEENNFTFDGETNIIIEIRRVTKHLSLHALDLTINETMTTLVNNDGVIYAPKVHNYNNITNILVLNFNVELPLGIYTLNIRFVGILHDDLYGFFRTSYINEEGNKVWLAVSHFEPTWARRAFPCWDEPALKATFNISIKHHRNYTALSNMPTREQSEDGNENDTIWTHFDTTPVMSTYLVTFVVANYVRISNKDGTINMWCRPALASHSLYAQEIAEQAEQLLTEYTNTTNKVPKIDHVAVPEFAAGAMENWGIIVHAEDSFRYREGKDTTLMKLWVAIVAVHEMAHQWFGNIVTPSWWSDVWLNEGLASFFEKYILDQIYKDWRMMEYFVVKIQQNALHTDIAKYMKPVTSEVNSVLQITSLFSLSSYAKAPAILRMLQHILTNEVFRKGIIRYLHTHQFSSVTSDNLWSAMQAALDESNVPHNAYEVKEVMDTWIKQRHYPVVHVIRNNDTGEVILTQEFLPENENKDIDNDKWWIPVTFATQTNPDFSNTLPTHWLRPQDQNITIDEIDPNDWIIVNVQQIGYYRVNYDLSNWKKIAAYLKSSNYTKIHVLNRAQIIDDAYHLMVTKQLDIFTFLDLTSYLAQETDYIAWYPMFEILEITEDFYNFPVAAFIKPYLLEILKELVKNVGFEEDPMENDFTKIKRASALKWACTFGHSECKKMATIKLSEHLANPEIHTVSPNLKEWVYCNGIMEANETIWNKLMDIYVNNSDEDILEYLTCSENPDILIKFLNLTISQDSIIKKKHYKQTYAFILQKHADNDLVLDYVLTNLYKTISKKIDTEESIITAIIQSVHSNGRLYKISKSVKNNFTGKKLPKYIESMITKRRDELLSKFAIFT